MNSKRYKQCLNIICYIIITIACFVMIFFIQQKEGFHEDEMFSYGSSNYDKDNVFQPYGIKDYIGITIDNEIIHSENPLKSLFYYLVHPKEFMDKLKEEEKNEIPIWKTKAEAKEYLTIQKEDVFNFFSVYINQSRDAHPPLFYFLVHIVSVLFFNNFSKYIIFIINLTFFIGCCIILKKIMFTLHKEYLSIPVLAIYAFSIGAISTVIFQRMYMLLTFFIVLYTYMIIIYIQEDANIDKKYINKLRIIIVLGFMTQYYFCLYVVCMFIITEIIMYKKNKEKCKKFFKIHIDSAIIGIIIYPASIYHMFFSYRGVSAISNNFNINDFLNLICKAYSLKYLICIILLIIFTSISLYMLIKRKNKIIFILQFSILVYLIIVSKISPYLDMRYIMGILPIISIVVCFIIDTININSKYKIITVLTLIILIFSFYKISTQKPEYLYSGYKNNIKIANENRHLKFIYIEDNGFNHIQSMPEFMIYDTSLILNVNKNELKYLKDNEELQNEKCFIVSIKSYMDVENIINKVKELTKSSSVEILIDGKNETQNVIYKLYK